MLFSIFFLIFYSCLSVIIKEQVNSTPKKIFLVDKNRILFQKIDNFGIIGLITIIPYINV